MAAALVEMSAGIAESAAERDRASDIRERALALAEEELTSYEPVLEALRLPLRDPERPERLAAALDEASQHPGRRSPSWPRRPRSSARGWRPRPRPPCAATP